MLTGQKETQASFFPADQNVLDNPAPQKLTPTAKGLTLDLKKDANLTTNPAQLRGVLELSSGRAYEIAAPAGAPAAAVDKNTGETAAATSAATTPSPANSAPSSSPNQQESAPGLVRIVGLAFLGGLILNLMPCVFPVLFLKGLALMQSGTEERHRLRTHGLVYTAGILVSFWVLVAVLLGLRSAGGRLGWGFQFQSPVFLSLMAGLLFFLALSLAGQFEIGLSLTSAGRKPRREAGLYGQLLHRCSGGHRRHAVHRSFHGRRHRLRIGAAWRRHVCRFHRAGPGTGRPLRRPYPAAGLDARASQAWSLDGSPPPGRFGADLCAP